jgi:hypothetical protein
MLTGSVGACRKRQANRGHFFVPRLEPLEDRLTPSSLPPLNPVVSSQLAISASLLAQQQSVQPPSNQLAAAFLLFYALSARQQPTQTNDLARAEAVLVTDLEIAAINPQLQATDPLFNTRFLNVQNAIINNPVRNTPAGMATGVLAGSLGLNGLAAPSNQPLVAAFQVSYMLANQQNANTPGALDELVELEVAQTLDQIFRVVDPLLGINDPNLSVDRANVETAIAANPANATTFGSLTSHLVGGLIVSAFLAPG